MSSPSTERFPVLTVETAGRFAAIALGHVGREFPNKLDHVMDGPQDALTPRALHPVFFGSYDWHSCVHGYWLLARLLRLRPDMAEAGAVRALFDEAFTPAKVAVETAYLDRPASRGFERPYGWAWLLMLAAELRRGDAPEFAGWSETRAPLAEAFADRFKAFLPKATYPVRAGAHTNTAFGLRLGMEYARAAGDADLDALLSAKAREWYAADVDCQAGEPSGDDFLSPALVEAECMRAALPADDFAEWFGRFLPRLEARQPQTLFQPATVSDRSDGKIAHLDGLNLSRAWCWRGLAEAAPAGSALRGIGFEAARVHLDASLPHVAGDYMGEHWLASFALLALT